MSSAKGSGAGRTRPQAHQNRTAFRHNKGSKKTAAIRANANTGGLCQRCADKIEWRIKYRKYKPLSQPASCNGCKKRCVKAAYRTLCEECAGERCPQCGKEGAELRARVRSKAEEAREDEFLEGVVERMRERERRTVYRKVEKGENVLGHLIGDDSDEESKGEGETGVGEGSGSTDCGQVGERDDDSSASGSADCSASASGDGVEGENESGDVEDTTGELNTSSIG